MKTSALILGFLLAIQPSMGRAADGSAKAAFEQLKGLAGDWRAAKADSATVVNFRLIANGTTLVESWTMSPTRQSMTVYTMDGERLIATHYCPQGNAPRLQYTHTDTDGAHHFEFFDGANVQVPSGSHEHAFWIRREPSGELTRSETYIENNATYDPATDRGEVQSFVRLN